MGRSPSVIRRLQNNKPLYSAPRAAPNGQKRGRSRDGLAYPAKHVPREGCNGSWFAQRKYAKNKVPEPRSNLIGAEGSSAATLAAHGVHHLQDA